METGSERLREHRALGCPWEDGLEIARWGRGIALAVIMGLSQRQIEVFEVGGTHRTRGTCCALTACRHDKQASVGGINSF